MDSSRNIYVTNLYDNTVTKITSAGVVSVVATNVDGVSTPIGIAVDSLDNVYAANYGNNTVTKISSSGDITSYSVGPNPVGVTVDTSNNVYVTNYGGGSVSKITSSGVVSFIGNTGNNPYGITTDNAGNIYTADLGSSTVTKISPLELSTVTIAGQSAVLICNSSTVLAFPALDCIATITVDANTPQGITSLNISARSTDGTTTVTSTDNNSLVTIDTIPPVAPVVVSVGTYTNAPYITNDTTPEIKFTVESGTTVTADDYTCNTSETTATCIKNEPGYNYSQDFQYMTPTITDLIGNTTIGNEVSFIIKNSTTPNSYYVKNCTDTDTKFCNPISNKSKTISVKNKSENISTVVDVLKNKSTDVSDVVDAIKPAICSPELVITQNMSFGARNGLYNAYTQDDVQEVKKLQIHMNILGLESGPEDGIFGPITLSAVKRMQRALGTYQDGIVGTTTRLLITNFCEKLGN